jgi:lysyl-tRNA synthetase class 2
MTDSAEIQVDENEQIKVRKEKLQQLREEGQAYPNQFKRDVLASALHQEYDALDKEALVEKAVKIKVAGRIMTRRIMGKASFVTLQDMSGRIQLYVTRDELPEGYYNEQFKKWDIGDIVWAEGTLFKTKTDELSVRINDIQLLTKALRPLPDKWHGLAGVEARYRQRYLDLIVNEDARNIFKVRSSTVAAIREFYEERGFVEVETPMLQALAGGAAAKPFATHHNALDMPMFMRIAPELFLKRLVVGGLEKVFEINRNFRNEGLSTRHNPEFTMLESYEAYTDYQDAMNFIEALIRHVCQRALEKTTLEYQGDTLDFAQPFTRITMVDSILQFNPELSVADLQDFDKTKTIAIGMGIKVEANYGLGKLVTEIFEKTVEHRLMQPTFITEYPAEVSPLARRNDANPFITDRFELFIGGRELANGFSELNDPMIQEEVFMAQMDAKQSADDEAMPFDADYVTALEHGLPPTAGLGIGIDRLVMLLTDSPSIREVILFPHMRPAG